MCVGRVLKQILFFFVQFVSNGIRRDEGSTGGAEEASRARVRCAWAKFRELSPLLTASGASLKIKGKFTTYTSRV